ncbi:poly [ADP-ribose] polymerase 2 isoform X1 [Salvia hispanica]|uniref:poly [ADP-ribose] polymerase 2 isoform X1 n=2 Tax=Salvia hispanica TaxID=49212 RepID=UPI002009531D|nr:poly [ADP-ribose] polymerase 2 isoform X1 [Salvia hispanica]
MATKDLTVDELRDELAKRGLSTAGVKSTLARRLEAAIRDERDKPEDAKSRKRQRDGEANDADSEAPGKRKAIDELLSMTVKQLREEASNRGVSAAGTKQVLLERLSAADDKNASGDSQVDEESEEENVDFSAPQKGKYIDELRSMTVKQLREEASTRGISAAGTKQELLERLSASDDKNASDNDQMEEDNGEDNVDSSAPPKVKVIDDLHSMTVKQLREEASARGISAAGTKHKLLERLSAADSKNASVDEENKEENVDSNGPQDANVIDELQKMNIKQLREEAAKRGISASGTKKELLDRLCTHNDNVERDNDLVKEEAKEEKIVTTVKKGSAVMDKCLPDNIKAQYHVLQVGDEIYDAMLNQTNLGQNNNKFFVIQVLESDDSGRFMVYFRWGRVGVKGQTKLNGPYTSRQSAITEFEKKFYDKTRNCWCDRINFVSHPRSYTWLEMDYSESRNEPPAQTEKAPIRTLRPEESKVEPRIAKFISLICNMSMMQQQMMEIGYNAEKLPLGKLSEATISKGYGVLKRIADVIGQADRKSLEQLSGEFYTVIPHDFGFKKTSLFIIDTPQKLKMKLQMVEALGEIEVAMKLIEDGTDMEDPLYSQYKRLHCELLPLEVHSEEHSMIERYTKNTHAKTHSSYDVNIIQIFKVSREGESKQFEKFTSTKNRMLLWHGSRLTNWMGILSQGLRIAPPEAPSTGYMFGKGVYFADMFSKSANYCCSSKAASTGVLLLCEVALGDMAELQWANFNADQLPPGKLSTKGVGSTAPDISEARTLEDGVIVPMGKPKEQSGSKGSLLYNEYIVYNVEQIRMRYLVQVNFNFK